MTIFLPAAAVTALFKNKVKLLDGAIAVAPFGGENEFTAGVLLSGITPNAQLVESLIPA